jgi:hypothetical protein
LEPELDEDGYVVVSRFSDEDLAVTDPACNLAFDAPPPLPQGDWLAAVATAVAAPLDRPDDDVPSRAAQGEAGPDVEALPPWAEKPAPVEDLEGWDPGTDPLPGDDS